MADSNQNSQATTGSQAPTSDDFGVHSDEIVPKQIANHDKTLLASVRADGQWININDTLQMNNRQKDLHRVHNEVVEAQKGIVDAKAAADDATRKADSAVQAAQVASDTVASMSGAISDATSGAAAAVSQAKDALSNADATKTELQASINSNSKAIELKADKTTVDAVSGTVKENSASIDVLNGQIKNAVTSSTIDGLLDKKGYATQTFTQDLVKQTSDTWGVNLSRLEGKVDDNHKLDVKQMTNMQASIDGIQGTVTDNEKQTESKITELSDSISTKVSDALKNSSTITQLENDINLKVSKNDVISQINVEAGRTLIDSNKIYLDADSVVFGKDSKAFIPNAAITDLSADKVTAGTLKGITLEVDDAQDGKPATQKTYIADGKISTNSIDVTGDNANLPAITLGPTTYWVSRKQDVPEFGVGVNDGLTAGHAYTAFGYPKEGMFTSVGSGDLIGSNDTDRTDNYKKAYWHYGPQGVLNESNPNLPPDYPDLQDGDVALITIGINCQVSKTLQNPVVQLWTGWEGHDPFYTSTHKQTIYPGFHIYTFSFIYHEDYLKIDDNNSIDPAKTVMEVGFIWNNLANDTSVWSDYGQTGDGKKRFQWVRKSSSDDKNDYFESYLDITPNGDLYNWKDSHIPATNSDGTNVSEDHSSFMLTDGELHLNSINYVGSSEGQNATTDRRGVILSAQHGLVFGQDDTAQPRLTFTGNSGYDDFVETYETNWNSTSGITFDGFGNIHAGSSSWAWKIKDSSGNDIFDVPTNGTGNFLLNTGTNDAKILIEGGHLDDANNGNVTHQLTNLMVRNLHVTNWMGVDKGKPRVVETSQGPLAITAYETAEPYFGDIGESKTDEAKQVTVGIDRIFKETINTSEDYQVFLQSYSPAHVWVAKRYSNRFVVESDQPNALFGWELKARQKGFEHTRMQNMDSIMPSD